MNLFARSLGVPLDLQQALEALAGGALDEVDIVTANGRAFVHQYSVGIYARLVRLREQMEYRSRLGKIWATIRAMLSAVLRPPAFKVEITTSTGTVRQRASAVIVSNNPMGEGHIPYADRLDSGHLGVYVAKPVGSWTLILLLLRVMSGRWRGAPEISDGEDQNVQLFFPRRKRSDQAVIDGELIPLVDRVEIKAHHRALNVMMPAKGVDAAV